MKETTLFIEDAIKGGWKDGNKIEQRSDGIALVRFKDDAVYARLSYADILLDPLAWKAVGKTRGWEDGYPDRIYEAFDTFFYQLYNGDSIEEALEKISN